MVILHLETSASTCSVAISEYDKCLFYKADHEGRNHAALLSIFIEEGLQMLRDEGKKPDAVAVSSGPGSYTGLRIGVSTAKGICFALDIPLIGINTLELLACQAKAQIKDMDNILYIPMIDARRMEVYNAVFDKRMHLVRPAQAEILHPESFHTFLATHTVCFSGDGSPKLKEILQHENALFLDDLSPDARTMIAMAVEKFNKQEFEDVAYFEPQYVKEFFTTAKPFQARQF
ncbi:MAG: tRNA (adenosine(37)-N6)-threonylcarbamoyltransferase complex dimerization subunit type 1 TsaB [Paludibacter sp.]|jgi:tRNA threonylcarbamoyladenosine biosynthesis protein TsaB|nr:tRNA (adenosine(37)-N6)-threonylcarbamoyltransferase complex dimerization subunit type 1 TsaB [Paludibacter sp.]